MRTMRRTSQYWRFRVATEFPLFLSSLLMPPRDEAPSEDSDVRVYLSGPRKQRLKERYGWGNGLPNIPRDTALPDQLERAEALRAIGLEKRGDRAEICGRVGELFECAKCGRPFKKKWGCRLRSCPDFAKKIFA